MKIKDLPKVDRPREKLEKYGPALPVRSLIRRRERLSDSELPVVIISDKMQTLFSMPSLPFVKKWWGDWIFKRA